MPKTNEVTLVSVIMSVNYICQRKEVCMHSDNEHMSFSTSGGHNDQEAETYVDAMTTINIFECPSCNGYHVFDV